MYAVIGWAVAQVFQTKVMYKAEVLSPIFIMPAFLHLIDTMLFAIERPHGRVTAFNSCSKHKGMAGWPKMRGVFHIIAFLVSGIARVERKFEIGHLVVDA